MRMRARIKSQSGRMLGVDGLSSYYPGNMPAHQVEGGTLHSQKDMYYYL